MIRVTGEITVKADTQSEWNAFTGGGQPDLPPGVTVVEDDSANFRLVLAVDQDHTGNYVPAPGA